MLAHAMTTPLLVSNLIVLNSNPDIPNSNPDIPNSLYGYFQAAIRVKFLPSPLAKCLFIPMHPWNALGYHTRPRGVRQLQTKHSKSTVNQAKGSIPT